MEHQIVCTECEQNIDKGRKWYWLKDKCFCDKCMVDKYPDLSDTFEKKTKNRHKSP